MKSAFPCLTTRWRALCLASLLCSSLLEWSLPAAAADASEGQQPANPWQPAWDHDYRDFVETLLIHQDSCFVAGGGQVLQLDLRDGRERHALRIPGATILDLQAVDHVLLVFYRSNQGDAADEAPASQGDLRPLAAAAAKYTAFQATNGPGVMLAFDLSSHKKLWESRGWSAEGIPVVGNNRVILNRSPGGVSALDMETGKRLWQNDLYRIGPGSSEMSIEVNSFGTELTAVAFDGGKAVWHTSVPQFKARSLDLELKQATGKDNYYLLMRLPEDKPVYEKRKIDTVLFAGKKADGRPLWKVRYADRQPACPPMVLNGKVIWIACGVPPDGTGGIYALSESNGHPVWSRTLKVDPTGVPALIGEENEVVLVSQEQDNVAAILGLDAQSGNVKWRYVGAANARFPGRFSGFPNLACSARYLIYFEELKIRALKRK
jgi:outer membrane protein assembly factor BamB